MHLIYSALRPVDQAITNHGVQDNSEIQLRYHAYLSACEKHGDIIKEIQKYFPHWMPPFK